MATDWNYARPTARSPSRCNVLRNESPGIENKKATMTRTLIHWASSLVLLVLAGCASLEPRPPLPDGHALVPATGTQLDDVIAPAEAQRPGQSGFRLVREGPEA